MQTLTNGILTVEVSELGAELQSIRKDGKEYLWYGDPAYWDRRSPVLFPIVGSVWEKRFRVNGKEYELGQHGFARDQRFEVVSVTDTEIWYRLESTEQTLEVYPWAFILEIGYRLSGSTLEVLWKVTNPGQDEMYFQIGAHPAFLYPDYDKETADRGFFVFDRTEDLQCIGLKEKGCVDADARYPLPLNEEGMLHLKRDTFDPVNTFVLQDDQVHKVTFLKPDRSPYLTVTYDAPVVGLWSPPELDAPFVCIEPWYGRCDRAPYEGEFKDKDWINRLVPGETFRAAYTIEIA